MLGVATAASVAGIGSVLGAGSSSATPVDDLPAVINGIANSSSDSGLPDLRLQDLLPLIPGLPSVPGLPRSEDRPGMSRCTSVTQVGDSTSLNADVASALPAADDTATAHYRRVGARDVRVDALSGRAVVDGPSPDATAAVASQLAAGRHGCWVIAMGVNDAGAISSGSSVNADARIDAIMRQLQGQPVLWPTIASSNPANPAFGTAAMTTFNDALRRATTRYPNLAVYDWASVARPDMFTDGIHYTAAATAQRNRRFADALATAYPHGAGAAPATRLVAG